MKTTLNALCYSDVHGWGATAGNKITLFKVIPQQSERWGGVKTSQMNEAVLRFSGQAKANFNFDCFSLSWAIWYIRSQKWHSPYISFMRTIWNSTVNWTAGVTLNLSGENNEPKYFMPSSIIDVCRPFDIIIFVWQNWLESVFHSVCATFLVLCGSADGSAQQDHRVARLLSHHFWLSIACGGYCCWFNTLKRSLDYAKQIKAKEEFYSLRMQTLMACSAALQHSLLQWLMRHTQPVPSPVWESMMTYWQ